MGYWKEQVDEFCRIFGFSLEIRFGGLFYRPGSQNRRYVMKCGRSTVVYKDPNKTWSSGTLPVEFTYGFGHGAEEECMAGLFRLLSGRELVICGTGERMPSKYGFTKIRTERHILLPKFGSVEELKLKLELTE